MARKFFNIKNSPGNTGVITKAKKTRNRVDPLEAYKAGKPDCVKCTLFKTCKNPMIAVTGKGKKKILIVNEHPGSISDSEGVGFMDMGDQHLEKVLKTLGINMKEDCWLTYSNTCRPPKVGDSKRQKITVKQIRCCRPQLMETIEKLKPKAIWLLGNNSLVSMLDGRLKYLTVNRFERHLIPDQHFKTHLISIYGPNFLYRRNKDNRMEIDKSLNEMFNRQLKFAIDSLKVKEFPNYNKLKENITCYYTFQEIINLLSRVYENNNRMIYDYETSGTKPYRPGHRIESVSLAIKEEGINKAYSFPLQRADLWTKKQLEEITDLWTLILAEKDIKLVAHNAKFEELWGRVLLDTEGEGWEACTMNTAHILDSRQKYCALKFQTYLNFGIIGYDWEIAHYLEAKPGEEFNTIHDAPLPQLLKYGAYDSLFTAELFDKQQFKLSRTKGLRKANDFWFEGIKTFMKMEKNGIKVDEKFYLKMDKRLTKRIENLESQLFNSKEAELFKTSTGKIINFKSNKDMIHLLFNLLELESIKETKGGNKSVDAEALTEIQHPFIDMLLGKKRLDKIKGTYLAQFIREMYNGEIHPNLNLHIARTYRSSCNDPNLQNIPVRDEEAKAICRKGIIPSIGNRIAEIDYGALEVKIAACYTKDPVLVEQLTNGIDMHNLQARNIFKLSEKAVSTKIRFHAKNGFVFPQFYGSWYKSCAMTLWPEIAGLKLSDGEPLKQHMRRVGLNTYGAFENHLKEVEKDFWGLYPVFKKWQNKILKTYSEKGYVEMFFGHRRGGFLSKNEVINAPIQGTGFHCLLWALIKMQEVLDAEDWKSKLIGQVHDSAIGDIYPSEQNNFISTLKSIGCEDIRKQNPWIIVPLTMDVEFSPINGTWYGKKEVKENEFGEWIDKDKRIYNAGY